MNISQNFDLVSLKEKDSNSILELINLIQPNIIWTIKYLKWQYFECPAGSSEIYGVKNSDEKIVAIYCAIPKIIKIENQDIRGRMIQDVMTHPNYRGRGFLHKLSEKCLTDMKKKGEVGYTFPNEKSEKSFRRNNWYQLNQIPLRVKKVGKLLVDKNKLNTISVEKDFDESISSIWEESNLKVGVKRDANFLNWRYRKPGTKYFKFILNSNQGLLVLKIFNQIEKNYVHICELLVKENNKEIISQALSFTEQFAKKNNCHFLTAWNDKNHEYSTYYDNFKMNLCSNTRYSFVYCDDEKFNNLKISQKWYLSQGDSDVY